MHSVLQRKSMGLRLLKILQVTHQASRRKGTWTRQAASRTLLPPFPRPGLATNQIGYWTDHWISASGSLQPRLFPHGLTTSSILSAVFLPLWCPTSTSLLSFPKKLLSAGPHFSEWCDTIHGVPQPYLLHLLPPSRLKVMGLQGGPSSWAQHSGTSLSLEVFTSLAAAKSLQSCPTLCNPTDGSPPGSPVPGILQARTLEWAAISSNAWKWKVKVKSLSRFRLFATPWNAAYQAPPSIGFSRQEYWSGVPLPSPLHPLASSKWKCLQFPAYLRLFSLPTNFFTTTPTPSLSCHLFQKAFCNFPMLPLTCLCTETVNKCLSSALAIKLPNHRHLKFTCWCTTGT